MSRLGTDTSKIMPIKSKTGKLLSSDSSEEEQNQRWVEHFILTRSST